MVMICAMYQPVPSSAGSVARRTHVVDHERHTVSVSIVEPSSPVDTKDGTDRRSLGDGRLTTPSAHGNSVVRLLNSPAKQQWAANRPTLGSRRQKSCIISTRNSTEHLETDTPCGIRSYPTSYLGDPL